MPIYSNESIKKFPWLWKFDSRRDGSCQKNGHRSRWFICKRKPFSCYIGVCKKCDYTSYYRLFLDKTGSIAKVNKEFLAITEISKEEAEQLMGQYTEQNFQATAAPRSKQGSVLMSQSEMKG